MHRTRAFTILELLVSMAVLAALTVLLATLFQSASHAWQASGSRSERNRSGQVLMEYAARELRSAALPVETLSKAGAPNLQFLVNPPPVSVPEDCRNPHCLFWQAPVATEQSWGEFAEVGYFVKWEPVGETAVPSLRRFFVNPSYYDQTTGRQERNPDFRIYSHYASWLTPELIEKVAPADAVSGYAGLVAENVLGLWVRLYDPDGKEIMESPSAAVPESQFDSRAGYRYTPLPAEGGTGSSQIRYLPSRVSLSIAQLHGRHAAQMGTAWKRVRELANAPETLDAAAFVTRFQEAAQKDAALRALLPGLRTYQVSTVLENAR
ncbi:MAG TPA: type II secretion system protein [Prosthecobacter sp.]